MTDASIDGVITTARVDDVTQAISCKHHTCLAAGGIGHVRGAVHVAHDGWHGQIAFNVTTGDRAFGIDRQVKGLIRETRAIGGNRILNGQRYFVAGHQIGSQIDLPVGTDLRGTHDLPLGGQTMDQDRGQRQRRLGAQLQSQYTGKAIAELASIVARNDVNARCTGDEFWFGLRRG